MQFDLSQRDLSYWDTGQSDWVVAPGCYRVLLGFSSRDLPLPAEQTVNGGSCT